MQQRINKYMLEVNKLAHPLEENKICVEHMRLEIQ